MLSIGRPKEIFASSERFLWAVKSFSFQKIYGFIDRFVLVDYKNMVEFPITPSIPMAVIEICINLCCSFWSIRIPILSIYFLSLNLFAKCYFFAIGSNDDMIYLSYFVKYRPSFSCIFRNKNLLTFLGI